MQPAQPSSRSQTSTCQQATNEHRGAHPLAALPLRVAQQLSVLRAAHLLEADDGQVCFPAVAGAVDFVRFAVAAVAGVLFYQPDLRSKLFRNGACGAEPAEWPPSWRHRTRARASAPT